MYYTESGVRLRRRGSVSFGLYKYGFVVSLLVNLLFAIGLLDQSTIITAGERVRAIILSLN